MEVCSDGQLVQQSIENVSKFAKFPEGLSGKCFESLQGSSVLFKEIGSSKFDSSLCRYKSSGSAPEPVQPHPCYLELEPVNRARETDCLG